jgi:hypothetical protein
MSDPSKFTDDRIDSLVRSYLADDSRRVDTAANLRAVQERLAQAQDEDVISIRRQVFRKRVRWVMSIAAILLVGAGTAYLALDPTPTSAYSIMSAASAAITPDSDRCYRIEIAARANRFKRHPILRNIDGSLVWTRGDRFRVTPDGPHGNLTMGQDDRRKFWVVCSDKVGLSYNPGEVPQLLGTVRNVLNLDVEKLTKQFLQHYSFEFEEPAPGDGSDTVVLRATANPGSPRLVIDSARLTIERRTNVIRKMELSRMADGEPLGTITFTLVSAEPQAASSYRLQDHLGPKAEILGRDQSEERAKALHELLAP